MSPLVASVRVLSLDRKHAYLSAGSGREGNLSSGDLAPKQSDVILRTTPIESLIASQSKCLGHEKESEKNCVAVS